MMTETSGVKNAVDLDTKNMLYFS